MKRILFSAYACEPHAGSEPGGGYAILRAAAHHGECWVLTRANNVPPLSLALKEDPPPNPVHVVPVDLSPTALRLKRRTGAIRAYYALWQRKARRVAELLDQRLEFDLVHHATFSTFWLPIGLLGSTRPLVVGPVSGGTFTPRPLLGYLGWKGLVSDGIRYATVQAAARRVGRRFRSNVASLITQNQQMLEFADIRLIHPGIFVIAHPHASEPDIDAIPAVAERRAEVLWIGRILPWKGGALALHAFALSGLPNHFSLSFIGEGPDRSRLERLARRLQVNDQVRFIGSLPRTQVLERMASASALLFPSFHDSAGFVVSEALSLGVPVVCLDHGGPGSLTRLWPQSLSTAVPVGSRRQVVADLVEALERYALRPAPVPDRVLRAIIPLHEVLGKAYAAALDHGPR